MCRPNFPAFDLHLFAQQIHPIFRRDPGFSAPVWHGHANAYELWSMDVGESFGGTRSCLITKIRMRRWTEALSLRVRRSVLNRKAEGVLGSVATSWSGWKAPLVLVTPQTVVHWHRAGFRLYWKWLSTARQIRGRRPISPELRALIFRMAAENPTWRAPRIHGELPKLGFQLSEPTVSRGCSGHPEALILASAGLHSSATTAKRLRQWTSLRCQRSRSESCIASLSSAMTAAEFCA